MQNCLEQFLLYSNSIWQEYYSILPLTQRIEIDEATYLEYVNKIAQIKLKRYDAYAKVLALSVVFQNQTGTKGKSSIDAALESYAVSLNSASASIDKWLTSLYCTPTNREESPCASFDPTFDAFDEYTNIKSLVVDIGNNGTNDVAAMIVTRINQQ
jgi:histidinol phosphatase-like enzyme